MSTGLNASWISKLHNKEEGGRVGVWLLIRRKNADRQAAATRQKSQASGQFWPRAARMGPEATMIVSLSFLRRRFAWCEWSYATA